MQVAKEDALIQDLDYFGSGVVCFWAFDGSVGLYETRLREEESIERELERRERREDSWRASLSPVLPPVPRISIYEELDKLRDIHINTLFEVDNEGDIPQINCSDCPQHTFTNIREFSIHLNSEGHTSCMKKRVRLMLELYKQVRHRYGFTGLDILMTGRICRMPLPIIKCELCPEWEHKILGGDDVPSVLAVGKAHLQSVEHPVKYDEEEVKEYMRRHSPAQLLSTNGKLLERLRKRHQGSNLELDIGKESGALIHCRDCHVYIHIQSSRRDDSSRTIRKVDDHFATTRHKRLARTRIENAKRRKRYEKLYFDETLTKRRRQIAPQRSKSSPGLNSQKVVELDDVILPMQRPTHH